MGERYTMCLELLAEKKADPKITYADIELETGQSMRQLMRLSKRLYENGALTLQVHHVAPS